LICIADAEIGQRSGIIRPKLQRPEKRTRKQQQQQKKKKKTERQKVKAEEKRRKKEGEKSEKCVFQEGPEQHQ
jgi:hypothetical protein